MCFSRTCSWCRWFLVGARLVLWFRPPRPLVPSGGRRSPGPPTQPEIYVKRHAVNFRIFYYTVNSQKFGTRFNTTPPENVCKKTWSELRIFFYHTVNPQTSGTFLIITILWVQGYPFFLKIAWCCIGTILLYRHYFVVSALFSARSRFCEMATGDRYKGCPDFPFNILQNNYSGPNVNCPFWQSML